MNPLISAASVIAAGLAVGLASIGPWTQSCHVVMVVSFLLEVVSFLLKVVIGC